MDSCPRCGFWYDERAGAGSLAEQQTNVCAYCRENFRRILARKRVLPEPTDDFPTWEPDAGAPPA